MKTSNTKLPNHFVHHFVHHWCLVLGAFFFALNSFAQLPNGASVRYDLSAWTSAQHVTNRNVWVKPLAVSGGAILYQELKFNSSSNGYFWVSNQFAGRYGVRLDAPDYTTFQIWVDNSNAVQYAASQMLAAGTATYPPGQTAWSIDSSDRRYARAGAAMNGADATFNSVLATNLGQLALWAKGGITFGPSQDGQLTADGGTIPGQLELTVADIAIANVTTNNVTGAASFTGTAYRGSRGAKFSTGFWDSLELFGMDAVGNFKVHGLGISADGGVDLINLGNDGSATFANGAMFSDAAGNLTAASATIGGSILGYDGSGSMASGLLSWDASGNAAVVGLTANSDALINGKLTVKHAGGAPTPNSDGNATAVFDNGGNACNVWLNVPTTAHGGVNSTIGITVEGSYMHGIAYDVTNNWMVITPQGGNPSFLVTKGLFVDANGNIGISNSAPAATLDVSGSIKASGTYTGNGSGLTNLARAVWSGTTGNAAIAAATTYFFPPNNSSATLPTTDASGGTRAPLTHACVLQNFYAVQSAVSGSGKNITYTLLTNGVSTGITFAINGTSALSGNDTTHKTVSVPAGVEVGVKIVSDAGSGTPKICWSFEGN